MFERQIDYIKSKWNELLTTRYNFVDTPQPPSKTFIELHTLLTTQPEPITEPEEASEADDFWAFEMYNGQWVDENGKLNDPVFTFIREPHEGTWMSILDRILDAIEEHYGYNIKEQVYYSVTFPLNHPESSSYGRELNDEVLQKLLLSFPEVYETGRIK